MAGIWRVYTPTNIQWAATALNPDELDFIESEINKSKTKRTSGPWEPWIKAPFDFPLPIGAKYGARFTPSGSMRNALYGGFEAVTAVFETTWHFLRFRKASSPALHCRREMRRIFTVGFHETAAIDIRTLPSAEMDRILDPFDYSASQAFAWAHSTAPSIIAPSVRHESGICAAVFDIAKLETKVSYMRELSYALTEDKEAVSVRADIEDITGVCVPTQNGRMHLRMS
ncbi:MAG TPA: RES family NAD+ phosphorylase [Oligoflexus sp.]|uniref:RES family NAD+ phosphorylase n=1 Tax=Oligoflexus sp. TaxID=1971216 RepID=UPI002D2DE986|nr:RES family NAD+ phosphorylase [Oligoflexus sp.]HYX32178.1 RES family NAD+ phosphorylase [Oligoflexus sp.]